MIAPINVKSSYRQLYCTVAKSKHNQSYILSSRYRFNLDVSFKTDVIIII